VTLLEEVFGAETVEYNCLGECGLNPENSFGYVNDQWVIVEDEPAFIDAARQILEN